MGAANWPAALAIHEAEIVVHRDLLDMAASAGEIELRLKWAGAALAAAYEFDEPLSVASALSDLRDAREALAVLIAEIEGRR